MRKNINLSGASILFSLLVSFIVYFAAGIFFSICAFSGNKYEKSVVQLKELSHYNLTVDSSGYVVNAADPQLVIGFGREKYVSSVLFDIRSLSVKKINVKIYYSNARHGYDEFTSVSETMSSGVRQIVLPLNDMADSIRFDIGDNGEKFKFGKIIINPHVSDMIKYPFKSIDYLKLCFTFVFVTFFLHLYPGFFVLVKRGINYGVVILNRNFSFEAVKNDVSKVKSAYQFAFWVFLYLYLCKYYIHIGSMIGPEIKWIFGYNDFFLYSSEFFAAIAVGRMIADRKWLYMILALSLLSAFYLSNLIAHNDLYIFINICLVVACYSMPYKRILRTFILSVGLLIIAEVVLSQFGIIQNLQYHASSGVRIAFGANYPTDFAAAVLYILFAFWLMFKRNNILMIVLLACFIWFQYKYTMTRNSIFCSILFCFFVLYNMLVEKFISARPVIWINRLMIFNFAMLSFVLMALLTVGLSWYFDYADNIFAYVDQLLSGRFAITHRLMAENGFSLFGKFIVMFGLGSTTEWQPFYNFLDISYCNMILRFGIVPLFMTAVAYIFLLKRAISNNLIKLVLVMFIISLHSAVEHHYLEICYNSLLLLMFSNLNDKTDYKNKTYDGSSV